MKTKVTNLLVLLVIIMGNVTTGCKSNENCGEQCSCIESQQKKFVCFRQSFYIEQLKNCEPCTQEQCKCKVPPAISQRRLRRKPKATCDCVTERIPLGLCARGRDNACIYDGVKCQCKSNDCGTCRAFSTCRECEDTAFNASVIECPGPLANPTRKNPVQPTPQSNPASSTTSPQTVAIQPSPVPANTNRGGSANKVGTIVGSVIGALVVVAVVVFGVYWKWGNRNRVY